MGAFKFYCPTCNKKYSATDELRGSEFDCKGCGQPVTIPRNEQSAAAGIELAKTNCSVCGGPLDLMGECKKCQHLTGQYRKEEKADGPSIHAKAAAGTGIFGKMMRARVKGMEKVIPGSTPGGPAPRRRKKR